MEIEQPYLQVISMQDNQQLMSDDFLLIEKWRDITISDIKPFYKVSNTGKIMNKVTRKPMKIGLNRGGYPVVGLACFSKKQRIFTIHRLVALTFILNPNPREKDTVNHENGDKENNYVPNLKWMSNADNVRDMYAHGRHPVKKGVDVPNNVYTEEQIHRVCKLLELGYSNKIISSETGVPKNIIGFIKKRTLWNHISCEYNFEGPKEKTKYQKFFPIFDNAILNGESWKELKERLGIYGSDTKIFRGLYRRREERLSKIIRKSSTTIQMEP